MSVRNERSVEQVKRKLAKERRERDRIISSQTIFCNRKARVMTPAECHDCFSRMPYMEKLIQFNENRRRCINLNSAPFEKKSKNIPKGSLQRQEFSKQKLLEQKSQSKENLQQERSLQFLETQPAVQNCCQEPISSKGHRELSPTQQPKRGKEEGEGKGKQGFSLESFLSKGLLGFLLDFDLLLERFEEWGAALPEAARKKVHQSAEIQELIVWFSEKINNFQTQVLHISHASEQHKEE